MARPGKMAAAQGCAITAASLALKETPALVGDRPGSLPDGGCFASGVRRAAAARHSRPDARRAAATRS
jgi:hypothetical protein